LRLMLDYCGRALAVLGEAVAVAEQVPAVPQIFEIAVRRRPDRRSAALPLAGHAIHRVGEKPDLRPALEHRDLRALGGGAVAVVSGGAAQESELGDEGAGLRGIGDRVA